MMTPEIAGVWISGILGFAGVVITGFFTIPRIFSKPSQFCSKHSGIEADIALIKALSQEMREDIKDLLKSTGTGGHK